MPAYNCSKFIHQPLSSMAAQFFKDFEVIVVDDVSSPEEFEKMNAIIEDFKRLCNMDIRVVKRTVNGGCGPALQTGLDNAKGDYFIPIDADDMFATSETFMMFARLIMQNGMPDCISTAFAQLDPVSGTLNVMSQNNHSFVHGKCFRVQFCRENNVTFPQQKWYEDGSFNFVAFNITQRVVRDPTVTYLWQTVESSITRSRDYNVEVQPFYVAAYTRAYPILKLKDETQANQVMTGLVNHSYYYWSAFENRTADQSKVADMIVAVRQAFDETGIIEAINADKNLFDFLAKNATGCKAAIEGQETGFIPKLSFNQWLKKFFDKEISWLKI